MRRYVLPYLWPIITGVLLAVVILFALPEQLPNPFRDSSPQLPQAPAPIVSNVPAVVEPRSDRPAPEIHQAAPLSRNEGPVSYARAVEQAAPAVVNIYSSRIVERDQHPLMSDPFFSNFSIIRAMTPRPINACSPV
ncbi:hypothetical protein HORIV_26270 [Vreelandella olivaria]|uniref:Uncharacterized protein n=1 Tax=Vreelandella olivaria TaxID=390919 RepID=A0ABN5X065_9GAMM|nr:hypothetical protein HORIV_26270 [Halomonas olivaria]